MAGNVAHTTQNFLLELEGQPAGRLFGMAGGGVHADVIKSSSSSFSAHKHIGQIKFEDMAVTCGTGMAQAFYDWIGSSFGGATKRKNGAIVALDYNFKPAWRLEFNNALISSVVFPECDAGSKDAGHITVSISPEMTRRFTSDLSQNTGVYTSNLPKGWHINDFKLSIDGLESDCAHVKRIGPMRLGRHIKLEADNLKDEGPEEFSDLVVTINFNHAHGFYDWFHEFVEKGRSSSVHEKKGVLQLLTPSLNKAYFKLELLGLGPYAMEGVKPVDPNTAMPFTFRLYCNEIRFSAGASAVM
jgi:T4-like virus tail tube protein gp19